jgi:urease beta subunit
MTFVLTHYHFDIFEMTNESIDFDQLLSFYTDAKGLIGSVSVKFEPGAKDIVFLRIPAKNK